MARTKRQLVSREQKWEMVKALSRSQRWTWRQSDHCWVTESERGGIEAALYQTDLDNDPALCAGFAKFHDSGFQVFPWATSSPGWLNKPFPPATIGLADLSEKEIDDFLNSNPWISEDLD